MDADIVKLQKKLLNDFSHLSREAKNLSVTDRNMLIFKLEEVVESNRDRMQILTDKIQSRIVRMDQMSADGRRQSPAMAQEIDEEMKVFIGKSDTQLARMRTHQETIELKLAELLNIRN